MTEKLFSKKMQRRIAQTTIGIQALRNQGPGMVEVARNYCEKIDCNSFFKSLKNKTRFRDFLNHHTLVLMSQFPKRGRKNWGAARKSLNLFFRELVYSKYFCDKYGIRRHMTKSSAYLQVLEIPLDKQVVTQIKRYYKNETFGWAGIKHLNSKTSDLLQAKAQELANIEGTARINLDLIYWRPQTED